MNTASATARISQGAGADVDAGPVQQRDEERQAVQQAEPGAGAGAAAVHGPATARRR